MASQVAHILNFRPSLEELQERVRQAASSAVWFADDLGIQMRNRGVSDIQLERLVRRGFIIGVPQPGTGDGGWQCDIEEPIHERRLHEVSSLMAELFAGELWVLKIRWNLT